MLSTNGVQLWYCEATTVTGNPPTTGFVAFSDLVTDFPGLTSTTNTINTTPIDEENFTRYVKGLADTGGSVDMTVNLGNDEQIKIDAIYAAADASDIKGVLWFALVHPNMTKCFEFAAELGPMAIPAVTSDAAFQTQISLVPQRVLSGLQTKPTLTP